MLPSNEPTSRSQHNYHAKYEFVVSPSFFSEPFRGCDFWTVNIFATLGYFTLLYSLTGISQSMRSKPHFTNLNLRVVMLSDSVHDKTPPSLVIIASSIIWIYSGAVAMHLKSPQPTRITHTHTLANLHVMMQQLTHYGCAICRALPMFGIF